MKQRTRPNNPEKLDREIHAHRVPTETWGLGAGVLVVLILVLAVWVGLEIQSSGAGLDVDVPAAPPEASLPSE